MNNQKDMDKQRLVYMDIFRAFGIILMVMGHVGFGETFDKFIHAFHMPMFFFISGFFYKQKEIAFIELIKKKSKSLLVPYYVFGLGCCIIVWLKDGLTFNPLIHLLTINTYGIPIAQAIWFLTALFFTEIIFFLLDRWNKKWIIIPLVLVGSYADQLLPYPLPWALSASFVGLGLYWCGNLVRKKQVKFSFAMNMRWWKCILAGVVVTSLIFWNGYINMREGKYAIIPLFWTNAVLSIFVGLSISKLVEKLTEGCWIEKWLVSIGRDSIIYVCMNQIVILVLTKIVAFLSLPAIAGKVVILNCSLLTLYAFSKIFTKTKLRILIGR